MPRPGRRAPAVAAGRATPPGEPCHFCDDPVPAVATFRDGADAACLLHAIWLLVQGAHGLSDPPFPTTVRRLPA